MFRLLLKLALAGAFLFALWTWVPLGGRTLAQRWRAAATPMDFVRGGLADAGVGGDAAEHEKPRTSPQARAGGRSRVDAASRERAPERVTEAERRALDRRLADELARDGQK
ncbi:MAG: hypothetical protein QM704_24800 [Anaeromyxobacteraceae bacterium]